MRTGSRRRTAVVVALCSVIAGTMVAVGSAATTPSAEAADDTSRYLPITPIRVLDSRNSAPPGQPAFGDRAQFNFSPITSAVAAAAGVDASQVTAVIMNVTTVDPVDVGFVTIWPRGEEKPFTSIVNPNSPGHIVANLATIPLGTGNQISVYTERATNLIFDVQGVFVAANSARAGRFIALDAPIRALDTRPNKLTAGQTITVDLTGAIPATASAAVLNLTATETVAGGFYTMWPFGEDRPNTSNLNVPGPNFNIANHAYTKVTGGKVHVFSEVGGAVIVDVLGYITGGSAPQSDAGLFVPVTPTRVLDTRDLRDSGTFFAPVFAGRLIEVPLAGRAGIPSSGASAVVMNVTAAETLAPGYVSVEPSGVVIVGDRATSTLNIPAASTAVPNQSSMRLVDGAIQIFTSGGTGLIVDVGGYFTSGPIPPPPPKPPVDTLVRPPTTLFNSFSPFSGAHAFLFDGGEQPGRWNPCVALRYRVNSDRATPNQIQAMNRAIAHVEQATGIDFVYVGPTSGHLDLTRQVSTQEEFQELVNSYPPDAEAVLGFSAGTETPGLEGSDTIGVGGALSTFDDGVVQLQLGFAYVDIAELDTLASVQATWAHEIGHMIGLNHVNDQKQLMFPFETSNRFFGPGDLEGFWKLGRAQGCMDGPPIRSGQRQSRPTATASTTSTTTTTTRTTPDRSWSDDAVWSREMSN